jgi:hypothetical protein
VKLQQVSHTVQASAEFVHQCSSAACFRESILSINCLLTAAAVLFPSCANTNTRTHTHIQQQFCAEDIELWGVSADVVVDLQILPRLLHISCAVMVIAPATTTVTASYRLTQVQQQLSARYYRSLADTTAAAAAAAATATAAAAAVADTAPPDVCILLRNGHYELLVPNGQAWTNGRQLTLCTYHYTIR